VSPNVGAFADVSSSYPPSTNRKRRDMTHAIFEKATDEKVVFAERRIKICSAGVEKKGNGSERAS
jgi:hypothetical protein